VALDARSASIAELSCEESASPWNNERVLGTSAFARADRTFLLFRRRAIGSLVLIRFFPVLPQSLT